MAVADDTPDDALVNRAQGGDRAALGLLVRRHQRALFALCLRYVGDADEAADLCQRSFVRAMGKLGDLRDAGVFRSWVLRIGAHLALNHIRDHARFVPDDGEVDHAADPRPRARPRRRRPSIGSRPPSRGGVARRRRLLPTKQRMTLELRIYEDLPFRDIGGGARHQRGGGEGELPLRGPQAARALAPADGGAHRAGKLE